MPMARGEPSSRGRGQHLAVRGRSCPTRCLLRGVGAGPPVRDRGLPSGANPGASFVTPSPISCHDIAPGSSCPSRSVDEHPPSYHVRTSSPGPAVGKEPPHDTPDAAPPTGPDPDSKTEGGAKSDQHGEGQMGLSFSVSAPCGSSAPDAPPVRAAPARPEPTRRSRAANSPQRLKLTPATKWGNSMSNSGQLG